MFGKLLLVILAAGTIACVLLVIRQQRIEAAHEMWRIHSRMNSGEQMLWDLRAQIYRHCGPGEVRRLVDGAAKEWMAIPMPEQSVRRELDPPAEQQFVNQQPAAESRGDYGG